MFGITPLGWVHTLGSLPAIPVALYMFGRYGRIEPRSPAGRVYLVSMVVGAVTAYLVAKDPVAYVIASLTLLSLFVGYAAMRVGALGSAARYIETISLSFSALLLMVPTVTETLTRVPNGNPLAKGIDSPLVLGAQGLVFAVFVVGLIVQMFMLRRRQFAA